MLRHQLIIIADLALFSPRWGPGRGARYPPDQQMTVTLPQKLVVQVQKYSDMVWVALALYTSQLPRV
jgi:hypothetical protein